MAHPVSCCENMRKYGGFGCLGIGVVTVLPMVGKVGYDVLATVFPKPVEVASNVLGAVGSLGYSALRVTGQVLGAGLGFIANDYAPAASRYVSGNDLVAGDYASIAIGTALAVSTMILGCLCFGAPKK